MALSSSHFVNILFIMCLLSSFSFTSQALLFNGLNIAGVQIGGVLTCEDRSIAVAKTYNVIPQAPVELVCGSGSTETVLKSGVTNLSGVYTFVFSLLDTLLFDPSKCELRFTIPANSTCTLSVPNGFLRAPLTVLNVVQSLIGNLLFIVGGTLTYVV